MNIGEYCYKFVHIYITNSMCTNLYLHSACVCKTSVPNVFYDRCNDVTQTESGTEVLQTQTNLYTSN
jgi:hypothetical protein